MERFAAHFRVDFGDWLTGLLTVRLAVCLAPLPDEQAERRQAATARKAECHVVAVMQYAGRQNDPAGQRDNRFGSGNDCRHRAAPGAGSFFRSFPCARSNGRVHCRPIAIWAKDGDRACSFACQYMVGVKAFCAAVRHGDLVVHVDVTDILSVVAALSCRAPSGFRAGLCDASLLGDGCSPSSQEVRSLRDLAFLWRRRELPCQEFRLAHDLNSTYELIRQLRIASTRQGDARVARMLPASLKPVLGEPASAEVAIGHALPRSIRLRESVAPRR